MSSPDPSPVALDYSSITFPSDRITLADLRRAHPERFDAEGGVGFHQTDGDATFVLNTLLYTERLLARAAFEKALGRPGDAVREIGGVERDDCVEGLSEDYAFYGVASGPRLTEQLVRDIEAQAAAQAGRPR